LEGIQVPLFDTHDKRANAIGSREYWRLFPPFQNRPLYAAIVEALDSYVEDKDVIDSSWAGSEILNKLQSESPDLFEGEDREWTGSLFGMTLWNYFFNRPDDWTFSPKENVNEEIEAYFYFPRPTRNR
jgi:hypothetical protein